MAVQSTWGRGPKASPHLPKLLPVAWESTLCWVSYGALRPALEGGLGLCKASKERVPRREWKLKAGRERQREGGGEGGQTWRVGVCGLSDLSGFLLPSVLPWAGAARIPWALGHSDLVHPCPPVALQPLSFDLGSPRTVYARLWLCPFSVSPVCCKACGQEDRLASQADGSSNPASALLAV